MKFWFRIGEIKFPNEIRIGSLKKVNENNEIIKQKVRKV